MAAFDTQVPTGNDPQYWYWARSIQQPEADKSKGIALKGIGEGIDQAAVIGDRAMKEQIESDSQDKYDSIRQDMTQALEKEAGRQTTGTGDPNDAMDLMPDSNKTQAPAAVDGQLSRIKSLQASRDSNKISETTYYQHLNSALKDLRATYPGYRDYVDSEASKITGVNPANAYMSSMIKDINTQRTAAAAQQNYWEKQIVQSGYSGSQQMLDQFKQSGDIAKVEHWYAANTEKQEGVKRALAAFSLSRAQDEDTQRKAEQAANAAITHAATDNFYNKKLIQSDPAGQTSSQISDAVKNMAAHPEGVDPNQVRVYGQQMEQLRAQNYLEVQQVLNSTKTKDGRSVADVLGPQKVKDMMDAGIGGLYDGIRTSLTNQDLGMVHAQQHAVADMIDNTSYMMLNDPTLGGKIRTFAALNKYATQMSPELQSQMIGNSDVGSDLMRFADHLKREGITNTGTPPGTNTTFNGAQKQVDNAASITNSPPSDKAKAYNNLLDLSKAIQEKDPAVSDAGIRYFFDPANKGSLNKLMDDYYDPSKGYVINGRTSAFARLTAEDNTKAVWKRYKEGNINAWDNYKGWATNEAAANLTTIAKTWNDNLAMNMDNTHTDRFSLRHFLSAATKGQISDDTAPMTNHQFYWDNEKHHIGLMNAKGEILPDNMWRLNTGLFAFRNANKYFDSLANIAHQEGTDPDALIFQTLKQAWPLDPESQKIFKAITQSHNKPVEHVP